jgi:hypothetical protein
LESAKLIKMTSDNNHIALLYESKIVNEGMLSRAGARVAGARTAVGTYAKNVGRSLIGKATASAGDAYASGKLNYIIKSASSNLIKDLQKLGFIPDGDVRQSTITRVQASLGELLQSGDLAGKGTPENDDTVMFKNEPYIWSGTGWAKYNPTTKKAGKYAPRPLQQQITAIWQQS